MFCRLYHLGARTSPPPPTQAQIKTLPWNPKQFKMITRNILLLTNSTKFNPPSISKFRCQRVDVSEEITHCLLQVPGALLVLPAACGELFWSAAVLSALGSTLAVIIGLPLNATIIVSGRPNSPAQV